MLYLRMKSANAPGVTCLSGAFADTAMLLNPEEQVPDLVDYLGVSTRLTTWEALIGGEYKVGCIFEVESGLHAIKVVGWNTCELTVFDCSAPLTTPFAIDDDAEYSIYPLGRFLVYRVLHDDKHVRHKDTCSALIELSSFISKAPLHVPGVNTIIDDLERGIEAGWYRTHVGMGDGGADPLFRRQGIEDSERL